LETFAWCQKGPDHGEFYEGVKWHISKEDTRRATFPRYIEVTEWNVKEPSKTYRDAVTKFAKLKGFDMKGQPW
jgi:hypothetical protein